MNWLSTTIFIASFERTTLVPFWAACDMELQNSSGLYWTFPNECRKSNYVWLFIPLTKQKRGSPDGNEWVREGFGEHQPARWDTLRFSIDALDTAGETPQTNTLGVPCGSGMVRRLLSLPCLWPQSPSSINHLREGLGVARREEEEEEEGWVDGWGGGARRRKTFQWPLVAKKDML